MLCTLGFSGWKFHLWIVVFTSNSQQTTIAQNIRNACGKDARHMYTILKKGCRRESRLRRRALRCGFLEAWIVHRGLLKTHIRKHIVPRHAHQQQQQFSRFNLIRNACNFARCPMLSCSAKAPSTLHRKQKSIVTAPRTTTKNQNIDFTCVRYPNALSPYRCCIHTDSYTDSLHIRREKSFRFVVCSYFFFLLQHVCVRFSRLL